MEIDDVRIRAVRGIRSEIRIPLGGKSLLIHGENGTGKSSIVDGLQWALRGEGEPASGAGLGTEEGFRRHVLEDASAPLVKVSFVGRGVVEVAPGRVHADEVGSLFREACIASTPFLRRTQVLNVLEDRPIDRFRYLEGFLDLAEADSVRAAIARKADEYRDQATRGAERVDVVTQRLVAMLPDEYRPASVSWESACAALVGFAANLQLTASDASASVLEAAAARAEQLAAGDELAAQRIRLTGAESDLRGLASRTPRFDEIQGLEERRGRLQAGHSTTELLELLEHAKRHFEIHGTDRTCPVCGQGVDPAAVRQQLAEKLTTLSELREVERALRSTVSLAQGWWTEFGACVQRIRTALRVASLSAIEGVPQLPPGADSVFRASTVAAFDESVRAVGAAHLGAWLGRVLEAVRARLELEIARLPRPGSTNDLRAFAAAARVVREHDAEVQRLRGDLLRLRTLGARFASVAEALRKARQDTAQTLLDQIATTVGRYYRTVHPRDSEQEVTDAPMIEIRRQREGTAYIRGSFGGRRIEDPRWVYSDGHLDTVGICIFLALRRFRADQGNKARLLVLDDIILSIDLGHARNLIALLRDEFSDHQVLLLTHNGLFAHWCGDLAPSFKRLVIRRWTLESGPQFGDYEPALDRLRRSMQGTSEKAIGVDLMALLDEWLFEARFACALAVPAKRGEQYTLTEIWDPFAKVIKEVERKLATPVGDAAALLQQLQDLPKIRNALAGHENEFAREYPLSVIRAVAEKVIRLMGLLYCFACHTCVAPVPDRWNPIALQCRCRRHQYLARAPGQVPAT